MTGSGLATATNGLVEHVVATSALQGSQATNGKSHAVTTVAEACLYDLPIVVQSMNVVARLRTRAY